MADTNGRIEHVDIMKGITIILVVFGHVSWVGYDDALYINTVLSNIRMPMYFFISGLFLSTSKKFMTFLVDKLNKHIIPFLFFGALYLLIEAFVLYPKEYATFLTPYFSLYVIILNLINIPLWFLESLFFSTILFYCLIKMTEIPSKRYNIIFLGIVSVILSIAGIHLSEYAELYRLDNPMSKLLNYTHISVSLEVLPFFYAAYVLREKGFLWWNPTDKTRFALMGLSLVIVLLTARQSTSFFNFQYDNPRLLMLTAAFSGILFLWLGTQWLTRYASKSLIYRYFRYLGRYSIIILGIHISYIHICEKWLPNVHFMIWFACILAVAPATIWLLKKLFPWFTAQKSLLPLPAYNTTNANKRRSYAAPGAIDNL
ncbi:MAG: acyltransferase [Pseudoflavonifractor sp.]|nr:acyltransferase [Pseudoflavonifractor sp.]